MSFAGNHWNELDGWLGQAVRQSEEVHYERGAHRRNHPGPRNKEQKSRRKGLQRTLHCQRTQAKKEKAQRPRQKDHDEEGVWLGNHISIVIFTFEFTQFFLRRNLWKKGDLSFAVFSGPRTRVQTSRGDRACQVQGSSRGWAWAPERGASAWRREESSPEGTSTKGTSKVRNLSQLLKSLLNS